MTSPDSTHRLHILFIGPLPEPVTGHSLACQVLLEALQRAHDVRVVNLSKASFGGGVTSVGRIGEVVAILRQVRRQVGQADVVYLTISESVAGNLKDLFIYLLSWRRLRRMVIHLHGGSIRSHVFDRYPILRAANAGFLRRIGTVIVLGRTHLRVFEGMVPANRQHIVANFAQDYLFANGETITAKFAATDVVHLLFLGNLIEGKGHADLLAGYRLLPGALRDRIRLHFAGAFDTPDESARFAALIAGDPSIRYHGVVSGEGKRELLALAHVLVLPTSLSEGQPISILEAYAAGCVVMTTPCGGIPDIFTDGVHGFAIAPGAPESIRDAIAAALAGHGELAAIARRNWETATTTYRTEAYTTRVVALIEAAGGGSHVPAGSGS